MSEPRKSKEPVFECPRCGAGRFLRSYTHLPTAYLVSDKNGAQKIHCQKCGYTGSAQIWGPTNTETRFIRIFIAVILASLLLGLVVSDNTLIVLWGAFAVVLLGFLFWHFTKYLQK